MDLLLTYGWVLVVIIGIIAVLATSGIFDIDAASGERCQMNDRGITCDPSGFNIISGAKTDGASVSLVLTNSKPSDIEINGLTIKYEDGTAANCDNVANAPIANASTIGVGANVNLSGPSSSNGIVFGCNSGLTDGTNVVKGEKESYDLTLKATINGIAVRINGNILGTAQ